jgi:uncharacterized protein (TIGR00255 family)
MMTSMTGYGRGEVRASGMTVTVEIRSVNSRYLEIGCYYPKRFTQKEFEMRDIVRKKVARGKLSVNVNIEYTGEATHAPVKFNQALAVSYHNALQEIKNTLQLPGAVELTHLLQFNDIFKGADNDSALQHEWEAISTAINNAVDALNDMRKKEGGELTKEFTKRIDHIETTLAAIEQSMAERIPQERLRLRERIAKLFESDEIDEQRLEMEIVLLADKLDVSEECVRLRSHIKFFREAIKDKEAGRKINFLLQEMNREINTIGSKSNDAGIAHQVVSMKEAVEIIREQIQNIE